MSIKAIDLRRGMAINYKDGLWVVVENEKVAKGRQLSYQTVQLRNFKSGQLARERFRPDEAFEQAIVDRKEMEYLYSDGANHVVMDPESFEQIELPAELIGERGVYLTPNIRIEVAFVEGQAAAAELPNTVELTVVNTPPQVKGATATNQPKEAVCEGGARVKVPSFVENGEKIKVDTRSGEYVSRA